MEHHNAPGTLPSQEEIIQEMKTNPAYQNFLKGFFGDDADRWIKEYARQKRTWLQWGKQFGAWQEKAKLQWLTAAAEHLQAIQQKKLFDAQCLWRAEQLEIAEVEIAFDFEVWERKIFQCPFISPVSRADVDLYIDFLKENCNPEQDKYAQWQGCYYDFRETPEGLATGEDCTEIPMWYVYHNRITGHGQYLALPDIRGEKETHYENLAFAKSRAEQEANPFVPEKRPRLSYLHKDQLDAFPRRYETQEVQNWREAYAWFQRHKHELDEVLMPIAQLFLDAEEAVPIEEGGPFMEVILRTEKEFKTRKIVDALGFVFDEYRMKMDTGLPMPEVQEGYEWISETREAEKETILKGRVLAGEPADFDF